MHQGSATADKLVQARFENGVGVELLRDLVLRSVSGAESDSADGGCVPMERTTVYAHVDNSYLALSD